jgi:hypothetical protein
MEIRNSSDINGMGTAVERTQTRGADANAAEADKLDLVGDCCNPLEKSRSEGSVDAEGRWEVDL